MARRKRKIDTAMRRFQLHRDEDETGVSGTGVVAEGVEFTNGTVSFTWMGVHRGFNNYESMKTAIELHGHGGKTRIVYLDPCRNGTPETKEIAP